MAKKHFTAEPVKATESVNPLVQIKPTRTAKSGRTLKAVFGLWQGKSLVTASGRLASRKDLGTISQVKGAALTQAYTDSVAGFNRLGEAALSFEHSEIASGRREMKRIYTNPKTGRTILETAPANKAVKVSKILEEQGIESEVVEKILAALKIA